MRLWIATEGSGGRPRHRSDRRLPIRNRVPGTGGRGDSVGPDIGFVALGAVFLDEGLLESERTNLQTRGTFY